MLESSYSYASQPSFGIDLEPGSSAHRRFPFRELQLLHSICKFSIASEPPFERGIMWSRVRSFVVLHILQYLSCFCETLSNSWNLRLLFVHERFWAYLSFRNWLTSLLISSWYCKRWPAAHFINPWMSEGGIFILSSGYISKSSWTRTSYMALYHSIPGSFLSFANPVVETLLVCIA